MRISDWSSDVCSSDLLHRLVILEIGLQCHRGRDAVALDQRHRLREDAPVQRLEEMHAIELYRQVLDDSIVDQDRAQKGGFRLDIAGQLAFVPGRDEGGEAGDFGHGAIMERSEEHTSELQSLMRMSYAVLCL